MRVLSESDAQAQSPDSGPTWKQEVMRSAKPFSTVGPNVPRYGDTEACTRTPCLLLPLRSPLAVIPGSGSPLAAITKSGPNSTPAPSSPAAAALDSAAVPPGGSLDPVEVEEDPGEDDPAAGTAGAVRNWLRSAK